MGIFTFLDDERLEDGDSISEELVKAIEESQVAVIVFSKNYATSSWCLNELVKIMECKEKENGHMTVIPIFYYVDPSDVRYQRERFADAFTKHESNYKDDEGRQKVKRWKTALTAAAGLKGHDIHAGINQGKEIKKIVSDISSKLCKSACSLSDLQDVVGIHAHLENLKPLLQMETNNVWIVGIWGTGGIEKKDGYVSNEFDGKRMIKSRLSSMKVLIVLDDIDHGDHLEYLAGDVDWFGNGSKVIVTTRNRKLIEDSDAIYEVHTLPDHEAMQLFNQHAFKKEVPDECFRKFSLEVVNQAKGLPLAIKVWGSMLHKKGIDKWEKIVDQIKKKPNSEIVEKLKISYDGLELEEQKIFLDIACFFRGHERKQVMKIVESCDFGAEYGLDVLIEKSLVFISEYGVIEMHDLIEDMGKYIVEGSGKPSRICNDEDFKYVVMDNMVSDSIEYLSNNLCWFVWHFYPWKLLPENFNPRRLVHLDLQWSSLHYLWKETELQQFLSLRRIDLSYSRCLKRTPDFKGMPNLEYLDLKKCTSLEEVDPSLKYCKKLIHLNLYECQSLERFPYVNVESLEYLDLCNCYSLEKFPETSDKGTAIKIKMSNTRIWELPLSFFDHQTHLTELDLSFMRNLASLPSSIYKLKGLVNLSVSWCSELASLPEEIGGLENLEELDASYTLISRPPSSIVQLNKLKSLRFGKADTRSEDGVYFEFPPVKKGLLSLESLDLSYCNIIDGRLPQDIGSLSSLKELNLSYCNIMDGGLPEDIGSLSSLKHLDLSGNNFEHLPQSISKLGCKRLTQLPEFPQQLDTIGADWSNASICNSLFQNISSLQHDIFSSHSLSLRVFGSWSDDIPSWFNYQGIRTSESVNLPKNWYVSDNFLGFAVCYSGQLIDCITAHLIPLCDDGMSSMTQEFSLSYNPELDDIDESVINFLLVPLCGLWDASNANEKTPNDYGCIKLDFIDGFGEEKKFGVRLLYKNESELCIGKKEE
ncbi:hypothetical protein KY285_006812 [Solanum tuberosum]|nr:hypothetical protein KY285_006812 [Solanum tuberosum]